jgi:hypothetical protein
LLFSYGSYWGNYGCVRTNTSANLRIGLLSLKWNDFGCISRWRESVRPVGVHRSMEAQERSRYHHHGRNDGRLTHILVKEGSIHTRRQLVNQSKTKVLHKSRSVS